MRWALILGLGIPLAYITIGILTARYLYVDTLPQYYCSAQKWMEDFRTLYERMSVEEFLEKGNHPYSLYGSGELVVFGGIFWPFVLPVYWMKKFVTRKPPPLPEEMRKDFIAPDWITKERL